MEEGKGQGDLATSHQYGNALLGVCYQEEELGSLDPPVQLSQFFGLQRKTESPEETHVPYHILCLLSSPCCFYSMSAVRSVVLAIVEMSVCLTVCLSVQRVRPSSADTVSQRHKQVASVTNIPQDYSFCEIRFIQKL